MALVEDIRRIVREQRPEGLTDYKLAKLLGVHQSTVGRFIAGGGITPELLDRLADLFGITVTADPKHAVRAMKRAERDAA